tara:strand:- start:312 stop:509 length:198 start_codon:yes stop_codon:yes gene_type:complete
MSIATYLQNRADTLLARATDRDHAIALIDYTVEGLDLRRIDPEEFAELHDVVRAIYTYIDQVWGE